MRHANVAELITLGDKWIYPNIELTAVSKPVETKRYGKHYATTFRLHGDRISQTAAELLLAEYPVCDKN